MNLPAGGQLLCFGQYWFKTPIRYNKLCASEHKRVINYDGYSMPFKLIDMLLIVKLQTIGIDEMRAYSSVFACKVSPLHQKYKKLPANHSGIFSGLKTVISNFIINQTYKPHLNTFHYNKSP